MAVQYRLVRSDRRTLAIEISREGEVIVRCPRRLGRAQVDAFVASRESWIRDHLAKRASIPRQAPLSSEERKDLARQAGVWFSDRVALLASLVGVDYGRITIRSQRTRWGSCSGKGNLNFNCLLMLADEPVRDYVIIHELCHRLEMNHSPAFWAHVERVMPDYRVHRKWLKDNGAALLARL